MTPEQFAAAGAELERLVETAKGAMCAALLAGDDTVPVRAKLQEIAADMEKHAARFACLRAEAEAAAEQVVQAAAGQIARVSAERLRFALARVAVPHPPRSMRRCA